MPAAAKQNETAPLKDAEVLSDAEDKKSKKKKDKKNKDKKSKNQKKKGFPVVPIIVLLVIIGGITAVMYFNLFDVREGYVMPYLRNMPLVGPLFPQPELTDEEITAEGYAALSHEELVSMNTALEYQIQQLELEKKNLETQGQRDRETIAYLRGFENLIENYRQTKALFDHMIAMGDPQAYAGFYSAVSPENAEWLYREVVGEIQFSTDERNLSKTVAGMSPKSAAGVLERLLTSQSDLVVRILKNMSVNDRSAILDAMETANAAVIIRLMAPLAPEPLPLPTAPPLAMPNPVPAAPPDNITEETAEPEAEPTDEAPEPILIP